MTDTKEMAMNELGKNGSTAPDGIADTQPNLPLEFAMGTVTATLQLKTGSYPPSLGGIDVRSFSMHKAKAMRLGVAFPTFVIRTNKQRRSYSLPGREDDILPPGATMKGE